jgi:membrane protease YdiL (CAAX protease family)
MQQEEFSLLDFVLIYAIYFTSGVLLFGLSGFFFPNPQGSTKVLVILWMTLLSNGICVLAFLWMGRLRDRRTWAELGLSWPGWGTALKWSLIFFPITLGFSVVYGLILKYLLHLPTPTQQVATYFHYEHPLWIRMFALFVVIVSAPLTEELIYRGILHRALRQRFPFVLAASMSGLIFGLVHFELQALVPLVFLGFMFAFVYEKTRSLPLAMFLHAVNNTLAFLLVMFREATQDINTYQWILWEWVVW